MAQARRTVAELQAAQAQVPQGVRLPKDINLSMVDPDVDSWAAAPTVETLLPKIVTLWDELSVSLLHRSRFYQHFRGR